jgi:hypothetical protein
LKKTAPHEFKGSKSKEEKSLRGRKKAKCTDARPPPRGPNTTQRDRSPALSATAEQADGRGVFSFEGAVAMTEAAGRLVWVKDGYGRTWPERWPDDAPAAWMRDRNIVALYRLTPEQMTRPLVELERAWPAPKLLPLDRAE